MRQRTGLWRERGGYGHVSGTWLKPVPFGLKQNKSTSRSLKIINRNIRRRNFYALLMGRPCSRQELHRQTRTLLLLVTAFILMLSLME